MKQCNPEALKRLITAVFSAAGSDRPEAETLADHLVTANLVGHESHGIVRVHKYLSWVARGDVVLNRHASIVSDRGGAVAVDGGFGYCQVIAREAMDILAGRAQELGFATLAIRNAGHLGRIGAWAEQLAKAGLVSAHFVNTSGFGILVAPHGGSDRRLSANPVAAGAPRVDGAPLVLDIATSIIAEGKIQMLRNRQEPLPEGAVLDGAGNPTTDAEAFYADPPGAILPFGAHKGSGLSFFCELLAGSLSGGYASNPESPTAGRLVNNMVSIAFHPDVFGADGFFAEDAKRLSAWVRGSPPLGKGGPVLLPGEIEAETRRRREAGGIPIDGTTWTQLADAARRIGVDADRFV